MEEKMVHLYGNKKGYKDKRDGNIYSEVVVSEKEVQFFEEVR